MFVGNIYRYINHPYLRYKNPSCPTGRYLFGYSLLKGERRVFVTEGPINSIVLAQSGYPSVATLGSNLSKKQTQLLENTGSELVWVVDFDTAGIKAATKAMELGYDLALLDPKFNDVNDMYLKEGKIQLKIIPPYTFKVLLNTM